MRLRFRQRCRFHFSRRRLAPRGNDKQNGQQHVADVPAIRVLLLASACGGAGSDPGLSLFPLLKALESGRFLGGQSNHLIALVSAPLQLTHRYVIVVVDPLDLCPYICSRDSALVEQVTGAGIVVVCLSVSCQFATTFIVVFSLSLFLIAQHLIEQPTNGVSMRSWLLKDLEGSARLFVRCVIVADRIEQTCNLVWQLVPDIPSIIPLRSRLDAHCSCPDPSAKLPRKASNESKESRRPSWDDRLCLWHPLQLRNCRRA